MSMTQRSNQWRQARLGAVTASRFADVLTAPSAKGVFGVEGQRGAWHVVDIDDGGPVSGDFDRKADAEERLKELVAEWAKTHWSQTAESYLNELLAERITRKPLDTWRSDATDWGTENEPYAFQAAIPAIEKRFGETLSLPEGEYAYVQHLTEPRIGCSPDGIIGNTSPAEIKCPYNPTKWISQYRKAQDLLRRVEDGEITSREAEVSLGRLLVTREYMAQVQGQMWIVGGQWSVFCYYDSRVAVSGIDPLLCARVERDDNYINNVLAPRVVAFRDYLQAEYQKLISEGEPF